MIAYNKLVRDKIPERLDAKKIPYEKRIAGDAEYKEELIKKLGEEAEEFMWAKSADESLQELADVMEVIEALKKLPDFADAEKIRREKFAERGGFDKRIILKGEK